MEDGGTTRTSLPPRGMASRRKNLADGKAGGTSRLCDAGPSLDAGTMTDSSQVQLVKLSMEQKDALTVLLTGRSESGFSDLVRRIVDSRKLEFDLICLKPEVGPNNARFSTTMEFKQSFLEDLVLTYEQADEIRIYEDRVKQ